jgi:hypothetical protein
MHDGTRDGDYPTHSRRLLSRPDSICRAAGGVFLCAFCLLPDPQVADWRGKAQCESGQHVAATLLANGFPIEWAARHVPGQSQLDDMVAIMRQGGRPIITAVGNGELVVTSAVATAQSDATVDENIMPYTAEAIAEPEPETLKRQVCRATKFSRFFMRDYRQTLSRRCRAIAPG